MMSESRVEVPGSWRLTMREDLTQTVIVIPARWSTIGAILATLFLLTWLSAGPIFIRDVHYQSDLKLSAFLGALLLLSFWALAAVCVAWNLLWLGFGAEELTATRTTLSYSRMIFGLRKMRNYETKSISHLRWIDGAVAGVIRPEDSGSLSSISFQYGSKSVELAHGTDIIEGELIVSALHKRMGMKGGHSYDE